MRMQIQEKSRSLGQVAQHFLGVVDLWLPHPVGIRPAAVEVVTEKRRARVTFNNAVGVEHRQYFEDNAPPQPRSEVIVRRRQELHHSVHQPA